MAVAATLAAITGGTFARDAVQHPVDGTSIHDFLSRHWKRPLAAQGLPPPTFSTLEASLAPESCGTCHPAQQADWKTSHHARAMGPRVTGQLKGLWKSDPESARLCLSCHAPLAEQQPQNRPIFDATLQRHGVVCAGCHVREHRRFGPPRREQAAPASSRPSRPPHDGATRTTAFLASEFCSSCHQFSTDGFALNGKLLENTYEEWKASPAAARGA